MLHEKAEGDDPLSPQFPKRTIYRRRGGMEHRPKSLWSRVARRLRQDFLAGILVIVPLAVVIWALSRMFISIDDFMEPVIKFVVGRPVVGTGFAITLPVILSGWASDDYCVGQEDHPIWRVTVRKGVFARGYLS